MPVTLERLVPMLMCEDVQASIAFYIDVLGFSVVGRMDDVGKTGWAHLAHGPAQVMLASPTYVPDGVKVDGRHPQAVYYVYTSDVVALWEAVRRHGVDTSDLAVRFYGMKEFEMTDPSGHVLVFGQSTDEAPTPERK